MIPALTLLGLLRPLHVCVGMTGHIGQVGVSVAKLGAGCLTGTRFLETFEILRPAQPSDMGGLRALAGQVLKLRLRAEPGIILRGLVVDDQAGGVIVDMSFGIAVVDAVQHFGLTARDFAPSDLAVELLFLQEAKSSAMAASFSLNSRLNGARLAAETEAMTDGLTGLHNRRALESAMARLGQSDTEYAVLNLDLDRFKQVNDTMGHAVGDAVLLRVATAMRAQTRQDDLLVRAGGDEFVIVCPGLDDRTRLNDLSASLIQAVSAPMQIDGQDVAVGASIGIAVSQSEARVDPETLIARADVALYAAKRSGRGQHVFWSPAMGQSLSELELPEATTQA
ncbi:MAG: diguanylate cyclase domain-containing protein [Marivita sp.]|uniref:diguanylate cyclase domain-containing protein n=1 Tax=Marivita sp. TaxID=2003365 RepID=UPI003EF24C29